MKSVLSDKHFHNEEAACAFVEKRLWPKALFALTSETAPYGQSRRAKKK